MKGSASVASPAFVTVAAHELAEERASVDLATLYALHAPTVARWAARLGGPGLDVEDAVHDVFLVVERRLATFRGASSVKTWLYGITVNVVRHQRRKRRLLRWLGLQDAPEVESIAALARTPAEELEQADAIRLVYAVLDRLSDTHRSVLVMHELEGLSGPEIAALTGVQPSTVWVRLHRARAAFLAELRALREKERWLAPAVIIFVLAVAGTTFAAIGGPAWLRSLLAPTENVSVPERTAPLERETVPAVEPKSELPEREVSERTNVAQGADDVARAPRRPEASVSVLDREVRVSTAARARRATVRAGEPIVGPAATEPEVKPAEDGRDVQDDGALDPARVAPEDRSPLEVPALDHRTIEVAPPRKLDASSREPERKTGPALPKRLDPAKPAWTPRAMREHAD